MKKVSLIIRAYNRLEYTIETLSSIITTTEYDNYEIILVNNNSKDGTTQWLKWIDENSSFYSDKIKSVNLSKNLGDWYGLVEGLKHVSDDCEYIMQVDNDVLVDDPKWLDKLVYVIENTPNKMVMLKRTGIDHRFELKPKKDIWEIKFNEDILTLCDVERPVCCYIIRKDDFENFTKKYDGIKGRESKYKLLGEYGFTTKLMNVTCFTYINKGKYIHTNKNVREFI